MTINEFITTYTCGLDETHWTAQQVIEHMKKWNEMPNGVVLWTPYEDESPAELVKEIDVHGNI